MFLRGDLGLVHVSDYTQGSVFGKSGTEASQFRGVLEFGFIFGNNLAGKIESSRHWNDIRLQTRPF